MSSQRIKTAVMHSNNVGCKERGFQMFHIFWTQDNELRVDVVDSHEQMRVRVRRCLAREYPILGIEVVK